MEILHSRAGSVDVHKKSAVARVRIMEGGTVVREVRSFAAKTAALIKLGE